MEHGRVELEIDDLTKGAEETGQDFMTAEDRQRH